MKKIILILLLGLLAACDPGYSIYIANRSQNNIYVETENAIESDIMLKKGNAYDSIVLKKINSSGIKGIYQLHPNQTIFLLGYFGVPTSDYFPYRSVKVIKDSDTLKIDKSYLMQKITKGKKGSYHINID